MERHKITISDNGAVTFANPVQMTFFEVAELFGVFVQTIRSNVKAILKSGVVTADVREGGTQEGNLILPDYCGLDTIIALSYRIDSRKARIFREWIVAKAVGQEKKGVGLQVLVAVSDTADSCFLN